MHYVKYVRKSNIMFVLEVWKSLYSSYKFQWSLKIWENIVRIADKRIFFPFDVTVVMNTTVWNIYNEMLINVQRQMLTIIPSLYVRNVINLFSYFQMLIQAS